jgi:hypothetical protein
MAQHRVRSLGVVVLDLSGDLSAGVAQAEEQDFFEE